MKAKKIKEFTNYKMNDEVYSLRRKVIELLYEIKKEIKSLPRIDVRIGEHDCKQTLGVARLKNNIIWISKRAIDKGIDVLRNTVYHEVVHAVTGFKHDEKCPLMQSYMDTILSKEECIKHLKKYIQ